MTDNVALVLECFRETRVFLDSNLPIQNLHAHLISCGYTQDVINKMLDTYERFI
ncbi:hypothetical protein CPT_Mendera_086 [Stenotrophomonas phage Mendera]|uniref:Uncharacterized protein n=3 Tax=Menderavirus TaxID=2843421 RepID=A0A482IG41_9CAUD|nr:hypothetical protein HWC11_gp088 [Stenotrophomonas phage YB07]YP_009850792.1 hypothetical protein HWC58_gp085 [Stenotrophomonas phage Moby]YP_009851143.1 hypothetical protein HWC60_gp086 [Stenotrophomonas phage Mendera]QXN67457.1 hypothetical protein [Stenotrophomonas phage BUCT608]QYW02632.1 hypothetical protein CPT_Marzo_090 [Stenotrophomonas phage Marzo]QBP06284.1 hypothetical protein [Stenotrophomonas phage YB07]QFR56635.1 hypothetical protein CPT_Mendera_086 [Stenotrophomonas phage Me